VSIAGDRHVLPGYSPPQRKSGWGGKLVVLLFVAVAFGAGWMAAASRLEQKTREAMPTHSVGKEHGSPEVVVTVEPVVRRAVQRSVEAFGTLHGFEEVTISARVEGRVTKVMHDVSDQVKPGECLLEIDPIDYELSVQQAERGLQVELAKLGLKEPPGTKLDLGKVPMVVKARSLMDHAKSRLERINRLAATKNVSAEDAETAANDYRTAQAEYDNQLVQAESDFATAQMKQVDLAIAREHLANTKVLAPIPKVEIPGSNEISYVIAQRSVAEGTLVRPGTEICRVVINQMLKLRVPVPERFSADVKLNQVVHVFTATSATPFPGTVTRISPIVESSTRTFQVEIQVPNPDGILKPGSFAKAAILTNVDTQAATVPLSALVQFAGVTKIYLEESGQSKEIPVTVGTQTTEWIEIASPSLPADARVITSGQSAIANDTPIMIRKPGELHSDTGASAIDAKAGGLGQGDRE
jgi:RND family efflux transporter MFP subunit